MNTHGKGRNREHLGNFLVGLAVRNQAQYFLLASGEHMGVQWQQARGRTFNQHIAFPNGQQRLPDDGREAVSQVPAADDAVACVLKAVMMRLQEINRSTSGTSPELFFLRIEIVITYIYC